MKPFNKSVSFVILALNEAANIHKTFLTVSDAVSRSKLEDYELIFVNDGSSDRTGDIMDEISRQFSRTRVIHNKHNLGFGAAYLEGVKISKKEYVMIIAGDNIMPTSSITAIIDSVGQIDMVLPYMLDAEYRQIIRRLGSWGFSRLINLIFGQNIHYYNSMVVRRDLFNKESISATGYSLQAECVLKFLKKGATYLEIGVDYGYRQTQFATSHALRWKNLKNLAISLTKLIAELKLKKH